MNFGFDLTLDDPIEFAGALQCISECTKNMAEVILTGEAIKRKEAESSQNEQEEPKKEKATKTKATKKKAEDKPQEEPQKAEEEPQPQKVEEEVKPTVDRATVHKAALGFLRSDNANNTPIMAAIFDKLGATNFNEITDDKLEAFADALRMEGVDL